MGRPPIPEHQRRTERVTINITRREREELESLAGDGSLSDFVRNLVVKFLARRKRR